MQIPLQFVTPVLLEYCPFTHKVHAVDADAEVYEPAAHCCWHSVTPAAEENFPGSQRPQEVLAGRLYVPAPQHSPTLLAPGVLVYVAAAGHCMQAPLATAPRADDHVPIPHEKHAVAAERLP